MSGLPEGVVIPDGIEPVVAWRTWNVAPDGLLTSVTNGVVWPAKRRLEARCTAGGHHVKYRWELRKLSRRDDEPHVQYTPGASAAGTVPFVSTTSPFTHTTASTVPAAFVVWQEDPIRPEKPRTEPPPGFEWVCVPEEDEPAPVENCSCGVYALASADGVPSAPVLGQVWLWGKVVKGSRGYRAQYAYPKAFHPAINRGSLHSPIADINRLAERYGVPLFPKKQEVEELEKDIQKVQLLLARGIIPPPRKNAPASWSWWSQWRSGGS